MHNVYIKITAAYEFALNQLFKRSRLLCGHLESGDYCNSTFSDLKGIDLGMIQTFGDLPLFFKHINKNILVISIEKYVESSILCGIEAFMNFTDTTSAFISSQPCNPEIFVFLGLYIYKADHHLYINQ